MNRLKDISRACLILFSLFLLIIDGCSRDGDNSSTSATGSGKSITISGNIRYEDKAYNNNGFTGATSFKPVRFAAVEVVRNADSTVLSSASTDSTGAYSIGFTNTGTAGVYVRVIAQTDNAQIKNLDNAIYAVKSSTVDDSSGTVFTGNIDITVLSGAGGAFNILDVFTDGITYLKGLVSTTPPILTGFWEKNSCDGTYTDSFDNSIHLLGGGSRLCLEDIGDTDEYDDDIILHEFGHYVAANFSRDDSPGGEHFLDDNIEDIRLAWSEGWAHFFSSAIRGNSGQVDTFTTLPGNAAFFEIEGPSDPADNIYTTSEVSVAAALWDIFDSGTNETFDMLSLGITPIWDGFTNYLTTAPSVSFEDFWDGWFINGHDDLAAMLSITENRQMELFEDGFEPDNSPNPARKIAIGTIEHHTLYPSGDKDVVAFDVTSGQSYTIETLNLSNGADTYIEILGSSGNPIAGKNNDNQNGITYPIDCPTITRSCPQNDATTLSSKVSITASTTETIYVRVSRSPSAPNSAGVYGSYDLKISGP